MPNHNIDILLVCDLKLCETICGKIGSRLVIVLSVKVFPSIDFFVRNIPESEPTLNE